MSSQTIADLQLKTQELLFSIIYHNRLEMSLLAEDAIWFVGSALVHLSKPEMQAYLDQIAIEDVLDTPKVTFAFAEHMGAECISIVGEVTYHTKIRRNTLITVTFNAAWLHTEGRWKVKQLITSSKSTHKGALNQHSEVRINDKLFLKSVPVGLVCCLNDDALPVQVINEKALSLMDYESITEYQHYAGKALFASIHPEDIQVFKSYLQSLWLEEVADGLNIRLRKKDYSYVWIQVFGTIVERKWVVLAIQDHSEHQNTVLNMQQENEKLGELQNDYRTLLNNVPGAFHRCVLTEFAHVDYVSDSLCEMTGYSQEDIHESMESYYAEMIVPEDRKAYTSALKSLSQYPHIEQLIYRMRRSDGTVIRVLDRLKSVRQEDGTMYAYSVSLELADHVTTSREAKGSQATDGKDAPRVEIRTFGYFEMLVNGEPVAFKSAKARELLAFLVDRGDNYVSRESIITALWENEPVNTTTTTRCRKTYKYLLDELKALGIEDIVSTENGMRRVVKDKVSCDYYDFLDGKPGAASKFKGSYLSEYSWSEITLSSLLS